MSQKIDEDKLNVFVAMAKCVPNWFSTTTIDRRWKWGRLDFRFHKRSADGLMGRFGGGWNWECGFRIGGNTIILMLLIATLRISIDKRTA